MDKNISAFLRTDAYTVNCTFQGQSKSYAYISTIPGIVAGDLLVVEYTGREGNRFSIVKVDSVDAHLEIQPNSEIEYKYVISKLDMTDYDKLLSDNQTLARTLGKAYAENMRRSFAAALMSSLGEADKLAITNILKGN